MEPTYLQEGSESSNMQYLSQEYHAASDHERPVFALIEKLLRQEQESKSYQARLESRVSGDAAAYFKLRGHYIQLEKRISGFHHLVAQYEASLRWAGDACHSMTQDLELERGKVRELESRLAELYPTVHSLREYLNSQRPDISGDRELQRENERQRDLIRCLQATLEAREETVTEMKAAMEATAGGLLYPGAPEVNMEGISGGEMSWRCQDNDDSSIDIVTETPSCGELE